MDRKILMFTLMLTILALPFITVNCQAASNGYTVKEVNHTVEVMSNGYLFVNDTIRLEGGSPQSFLMGIPEDYASHVLQCTAYSGNRTFPVTLDVPLDNQATFYGVKINFPNEAPQVFNVGFVLSQDLFVRQSSNVSRLEFPVYPALTQKAEVCNGSIVLPAVSQYLEGTVEGLNYSQENLSPLTSSLGNVTFSPPEDGISKVEITQLKRKIDIKGIGGVQVSDTYRITNKDLQEISSFEVILPQGVSLQGACDFLDRPLKEPKQISESPNRYQVFFTLKTGQSSPVESGDSYLFTVKYRLPRENYIRQEDGSFHASFPLYYNLDYYVLQSSTTMALPEGGQILNFPNSIQKGDYSVDKGVFQDTLTLRNQGVFSLNGVTLHLSYDYNPLWVAFRPTLWMVALTVIGGVVAALWKRKPKPTAPVTAPKKEKGKVTSQEIQSFVETYERKREASSKLKTLKTRADKGKISRRRYKVRKKTLETKMDTFSRKLDKLENKIKAAGGRYRNLMNRLEVAETEIDEVETNIRNIGIRHRRGDLSLSAYRELRSEYEERREEAETTIHRILLRLQEA